MIRNIISAFKWYRNWRAIRRADRIIARSRYIQTHRRLAAECKRKSPV